MIKRKRVYICDHCGAVELEVTWFTLLDRWKGPPDGWTKLGKEDLCPVCSAIYEKFKQQIIAGKDDIS